MLINPCRLDPGHRHEVTRNTLTYVSNVLCLMYWG